ncbi:hypothetical protein BGZ73_008948 [Actinomortierella ambigua]|nr:hypothetical protein BGZ73_008948 [Actinomortierella ambigua]
MTSAGSTPFIAFFGATGSCTYACLVFILNTSLHATALARAPKKFIDMLLAQGVSQDIIDNQLTIAQNDVANMSAIKRVLYAGAKIGNTSTPHTGVGGALQLAEICATATTNIVQALREIHSSVEREGVDGLARPLITVISTTGVSEIKEDVSFGFQTLYSKFPTVPHADKKVMEQLISDHMAQSDYSKRRFRGAKDRKGRKGIKSLRIGTEVEPAIGYTVHRTDVGN